MKLQGMMTVIVAVILTMLVAVPLINDASDSIYSVNQNTTQNFAAINTDSVDSFTVEIVNNKYLINGNEFIPPSTTADYRPMVISDKFLLMMNITSSPTVSMQLAFEGGTGPNITKLTLENGIWTWSTSSTSGTITGTTFLIYPDKNGTWGYFNSTPVNVSNDGYCYSMYYGPVWYTPESGSQQTYGVALVQKISKSANEGILQIGKATDSNYANNSTITRTASITENNGYFTVAPGSSVTATSDGNSYSRSVSHIFFAPIEYTYVSETQDITKTLLEIVPVILIASILIWIGYAIMANRD